MAVKTELEKALEIAKYIEHMDFDALADEVKAQPNQQLWRVWEILKWTARDLRIAAALQDAPCDE